MRLVLVALLLPGCDRIFQLEPIHGDAVGVDHSPMCWNPAYTDDEDGDTFIDGCDSCPADVTRQPMDTDGDGIDDTCDPRVMEAGDRIVDFDGFGTERGWIFVTGSWTTSGGVLTAFGGTESLAELATPLADHPVIDVLFNSSSGVGGYMFVGDLATRVRCDHQLLTASPDRVIFTVGSTTSTINFDVGGGPGRMHVGINDAGNAFCHIDRGGSAVDIVSMTDLGGTTTERIGLVSRTNATNFSSVTLFGR